VIGKKQDGSAQRKTVYGKTIRELEEKAAELRRQVGAGTVAQDGGITTGEWAWMWLKTYKTNVEHNTFYMYENAIKTHIIPAIGHIKIKNIRPFHMQHIINGMKEKGKTKITIITAQTLKQIFKRAVENSLLYKNPAEFIEVPKKTRAKKRALNDNEKACVISAELDIKMRAFLYVLLYAGLRRGEALALSWSDIDFSAKTITVSRTWIHNKNRPAIKPVPKSEAGNRIIPMPALLCEALDVLLANASQDLVFVSAKGEMMSEAAYRRFWEQIAKRLNTALGGNDKMWILPADITPHIFRHTYATMLFYAGVDMKTAQYLLGHSTLAMTMDIYTHLDKSKTNTAIGKIDTYLASSQCVVTTERVVVNPFCDTRPNPH